VYNHNTPLPQALLVRGLHLEEGRREERAGVRRDVEADDAVVALHLAQRAEHARLVLGWRGVRDPSQLGSDGRGRGAGAPTVFVDFSSSSAGAWGRENAFETSSVPSRSRPSRRPVAFRASSACLMIFVTTCENAGSAQLAGAATRRGGRTSALSSTVVTGISASGSISFTMDAGSASCVGAAGAGAAWTVGREAAMAAAMEGADAIVRVSDEDQPSRGKQRRQSVELVEEDGEEGWG
jgi:hypothetical protein